LQALDLCRLHVGQKRTDRFVLFCRSLLGLHRFFVFYRKISHQDRLGTTILDSVDP